MEKKYSFNREIDAVLEKVEEGKKPELKIETTTNTEKI